MPFACLNSKPIQDGSKKEPSARATAALCPCGRDPQLRMRYAQRGPRRLDRPPNRTPRFARARATGAAPEIQLGCEYKGRVGDLRVTSARRSYWHQNEDSSRVRLFSNITTKPQLWASMTRLMHVTAKYNRTTAQSQSSDSTLRHCRIVDCFPAQLRVGRSLTVRISCLEWPLLGKQRYIEEWTRFIYQGARGKGADGDWHFPYRW